MGVEQKVSLELVSIMLVGCFSVSGREGGAGAYAERRLEFQRYKEGLKYLMYIYIHINFLVSSV